MNRNLWLFRSFAFSVGTGVYRTALAEGNETVRLFMDASLVKIITDVNPGVTQGYVKILGTADEVYNEVRRQLKRTEIGALQSRGVVFAQLQKQPGNMTAKSGIGVFYKGEMIDSGSATEVKEALKDVTNLKGAKLTYALNGLISTGSGGELKFIDVISRNMVKQEKEMSCAAACVKQLAEDLGMKIPESRIRAMCEYTDELGIFDTDLASAIGQIFTNKTILVNSGIPFNPDFTVNGPTIKSLAQDFSNKGPWIASVKPLNGRGHSIIVDKIVGKKVYIRDPWPLESFEEGAKGVVGTIALDAFLAAWKNNWCGAVK